MEEQNLEPGELPSYAQMAEVTRPRQTALMEVGDNQFAARLDLIKDRAAQATLEAQDVREVLRGEFVPLLEDIRRMGEELKEFLASEPKEGTKQTPGGLRRAKTRAVNQQMEMLAGASRTMKELAGESLLVELLKGKSFTVVKATQNNYGGASGAKPVNDWEEFETGAAE